MTDRVHWQSNDDIDEDGLAAILDLKNSTHFVESGMGFSVDWANDQVTIGTTTAWGNHAIIRGSTGAYHVFPDQKTVNLATGSGVNHVFVRTDPTTNDDVSYHIDSDDSPPVDPSLKIGTIDAGAQTTTELNRAPDGEFESVSTDELLGNEAGLNLAEVIWPIRTQGGLFTTFFESVDGWEQQASGSGSISLGTEGVILSTGATSGSHARLSKKPSTTGEFQTYGFTDWSTDRAFATHVHFQDTQGPIYAVFGGVSEGTFTNEHFGFAMKGGDLVGTVADGSTEATTTLVSGATSGTYRLRAEFNSGTEAVFYVDGTQQGTISSNLPTGTNFINWLNTYHVENASSTDRALEVTTGRAGERA